MNTTHAVRNLKEAVGSRRADKLERAEIYKLIALMVSVVAKWRKRGAVEEKENVFLGKRAETRGRAGNIYLLLLRAVFEDDDDGRKLSAWAAASRYVESKVMKAKDIEAGAFELLVRFGVETARKRAAKLPKVKPKGVTKRVVPKSSGKFW